MSATIWAPDRQRHDIDHFGYRVLRDAFTEATAVYWERRARQFEAARPRRGDFTGRATPAEIVAQWDRLTAAAAACRARARFLDASITQFDETLAAIATDTPPLEQAEAQLRAAIDAGAHPDELARLTHAVDALDPASRPMGVAA